MIWKCRNWFTWCLESYPLKSKAAEAAQEISSRTILKNVSWNHIWKLDLLTRVYSWHGFYETYYKQHFLNSILPQGLVKPSIVMVVIFEIVTLISLLTGLYNLIVFDSLRILTFALQCSCVVLLVLLIGQRIAKDYAGSTSLTIYFLLNTFCLYLFYL